jgi:hypothetical protein
MDYERSVPIDLNLSPGTPYSLLNEASSFTNTPYVDELAPNSSYAMELYGLQSPMSGGFLSPAGSEDETATQEYQFFKPALESPILFETLADKFHGVLAQCMSNVHCVSPDSTNLSKMIKTFV